MANDASNYYASIGRSIVSKDGGSELTAAIDASAKTYAMNMANQQELHNAIDATVDNLSLTTKDANGNYTGFGKMFHDAVKSDKAEQIDKSADTIKQQKMDELAKMQNDLLAEQNNMQVDGLAKSITGQNYSDFKGRLQEAVEQKYLSAGGRPVSYGTLQYYIQNPSLVVDAAKAHEIAAQNGTVADTTLTPQDIAGLRAVLQDKNLITLFEKDRYIDLEKKRLDSGYFTPAENLDRARMLKEVNSWGYNTFTTQQVADLLNNQTAGTMGRKQGESYEENYDRIVNADNQVDLSASIDRFGFPISSTVNGNPATAQQANGNPITNSVNQATQQQVGGGGDVSQEQEDTFRPSTINEKGEIVATLKLTDSKGRPVETEIAVNEDNFTPEGVMILNDTVRGAAKLREMDEELDANKNDYINEQQLEGVKSRVAQNQELSKKGDMWKPSNVSPSNWEDSLHNKAGNFIADMSDGKIADFFVENAEALGIGSVGLAAAGGVVYGIYKWVNPKTGEVTNIPAKGSVPDKEFKQALDKAGITEEQFNSHKQKTLGRYRDFAKQAVKDGKMTQADYDKLFDKDGNPTQFNEQRMKEKFKKKHGKGPSKQDIDKAKEAFDNEKKGVVRKLKDVAVNAIKGTVKGATKGITKSVSKVGSKTFLGVAGLAYALLSGGVEAIDIALANGYYYKDIQDVMGVKDPDLKLENLRTTLDKINSHKQLKINFGDPNMPEPYANVTIEELEGHLSDIKAIMHHVENPKFDMYDDTISPVQSAGKWMNGDRRLKQYKDLYTYLNNVLDIKKTYLQSYAGQKAYIADQYAEKKRIFNYWEVKGLKHDYFQKQAENYQQLAENAKTQEERVKYQTLAFEAQKRQNEFNKKIDYQETVNRATVMGHNINTPAGQKAYNEVLFITSSLNDASYDSAQRFMLKDAKLPDSYENKVATFGREAPLIALLFMIGNGNALGNIDNVNSAKFKDIGQAFQGLYNTIYSGDIQGWISGDGALYSAYSKLTKAFSDSEEFRDSFRGFQHIEVLDREIIKLKNDKDIQHDAVLSASLGNTVKDLDAIGLYALKAALFAYKNRNADFTDPETMKQILRLDVKSAIKERIELAKQQKKTKH